MIGYHTSEHSIIQYALDENSYADILGYGISMAAKLTKLDNPNQIIISHAIYWFEYTIENEIFRNRTCSWYMEIYRLKDLARCLEIYLRDRQQMNCSILRFQTVPRCADLEFVSAEIACTS